MLRSPLRSPLSSATRAAATALALLLLPLLPACSSCGNGSGGDGLPGTGTASVVVAETPVPAPDGLLAEAYLAAPDALWSRLQRGVGGAVAILPTTFAGIALTLTGLDPLAAFEVDGTKPAFGVIADAAGAGSAGQPTFALALPLKNVRHTDDMLVAGETARYVVVKEVAPGLRALASKGAAPLALSVGIAKSGWLVIASSDADLARLGPYVYRTLPTKAPKTSDALTVVAGHDALAGSIRTRLATSWNAAKGGLVDSAERMRDLHDGGAADFADPPAILAVVDAPIQRRLALLGDLAEARLAFDVGDDDIHAVLTATPAAGNGPASQALASLVPGDTAPLKSAPGDAVAALLVRDTSDGRAGDASDIASGLERALGARLTPDDAKALHDGLDGWARARGDWVVASVATRAPPTITLRAPLAPLSDAGDASATALASVRELVSLANRPAFFEPLKSALHVTGFSMGAVDVPGAGQATLATFTRAAKPSSGGPHGARAAATTSVPSAGVAWIANAGELDVVASDADACAAALAGLQKPATTLGDDPLGARLLDGLESNATFAIFTQPVHAEKPGAPSAPAVLAWGRKGTDAWVRLDAAPLLLRELVSLATGL